MSDYPTSIWIRKDADGVYVASDNPNELVSGQGRILIGHYEFVEYQQVEMKVVHSTYRAPKKKTKK